MTVSSAQSPLSAPPLLSNRFTTVSTATESSFQPVTALTAAPRPDTPLISAGAALLSPWRPASALRPASGCRYPCHGGQVGGPHGRQQLPICPARRSSAWWPHAPRRPCAPRRSRIPGRSQCDYEFWCPSGLWLSIWLRLRVCRVQQGGGCSASIGAFVSGVLSVCSQIFGAGTRGLSLCGPIVFHVASEWLRIWWYAGMHSWGCRHAVWSAGDVPVMFRVLAGCPVVLDSGRFIPKPWEVWCGKGTCTPCHEVYSRLVV